jgi:hypothetical protein
VAGFYPEGDSAYRKPVALGFQRDQVTIGAVISIAVQKKIITTVSFSPDRIFSESRVD